MKFNLFLLTLVCLLGIYSGISFFQIEHDISVINYKMDLLKIDFKSHQTTINVMNDLTISREHSLQDSLEERIGDVERNIEELQYIFGKMNKKR